MLGFSHNKAPVGDDFYSCEFALADGSPSSLAEHRDKVLLIVNTASKCGFTPQLAGLQQLHEKYAERGLVVLGFPCNQFGKQEPGEAQEIVSFCQKNYGVDFLVAEKICVNGVRAHPLFQGLKRAARGLLGSSAIKWNFTKFLVDRHGKVKRFGSVVHPQKIATHIEARL